MDQRHRFPGAAMRSALAAGLVVAIAACAGPGASTSPPESARANRTGNAPTIATRTPDADLEIAGTGEAVSLSIPRSPASSTEAARAAALMNALGFDLYGRFDKGNVVFSPTSIAVALAMARPGARGVTATQMDAVMHDLAMASNLPAISSLDQALTQLNGTFEVPGGEKRPVAVRIANTAFAQSGWPMRKEYLTQLAATFGAGVRLTDYVNDPEAARKTINSWVAQQTEQRIEELIRPGIIDDSTRLTLVNAIYLKAPWAKRFSSAGDGAFTRADGSTVEVPFVLGDESLKYADGMGWRAVELPYVGGSLAMTVIVPDDVAAFEKALDAERFESIASSLSPCPVMLSFPKFSLDSKTELSTSLEALGMKDAFDPSAADFSAITGDRNLFLQAVIHQANIDVDEKGTEAAAATAVVVGLTSLPANPVKFHVDRPFIFALRDTRTGAILFLGRVVDPTSK